MDPFVFFDLDGTLTDPKVGITTCIARALEGQGAKIPDEQTLIACIGPPLQESFARLLDTDDPDRIQTALNDYRARFEEVGMFENEVYPLIPEALEELRGAGYRLCVATSKPHIYANQILEHFRLAPYFEHVFGPEMDGTRREKEKLLSHALVVTGAQPDRSLMIGDRKHDILGAHANSMRAMAVSWGYGSREEHEAAGADGRIESVSDLVHVIQAHL